MPEYTVTVKIVIERDIIVSAETSDQAGEEVSVQTPECLIEVGEVLVGKLGYSRMYVLPLEVKTNG